MSKIIEVLQGAPGLTQVASDMIGPTNPNGIMLDPGDNTKLYALPFPVINPSGTFTLKSVNGNLTWVLD